MTSQPANFRPSESPPRPENRLIAVYFLVDVDEVDAVVDDANDDVVDADDADDAILWIVYK